MTNDKALEISNLTIGYRQGKHDTFSYPALTCEADRGELIALIGRNGVGKSTLLRSIAKLQQPLSGQVQVLGRRTTHIGSERFAQMLSYIPAEPVHSPNTSVRSFVSMARYPYHGWFKSLNINDLHIVDQAIERVGLAHLTRRLVDSLSDGERQRAMIAFAIAQDTALVLMDEPTAFLDLPNKFEVVRLLKDLSLNGKTVMLSTHDLQTAISMVDTIWLMLPNGLKTGAPEDLILSKAFDELMLGTKVQLDPQTGQFAYHSQRTRLINLKHSRTIYYNWTQHALERNGFSLTNEIGDNVIKVEIVDHQIDTQWNVTHNHQVHAFKTIGEMSKFLRSIF